MENNIQPGTASPKRSLADPGPMFDLDVIQTIKLYLDEINACGGYGKLHIEISGGKVRLISMEKSAHFTARYVNPAPE